MLQHPSIRQRRPRRRARDGLGKAGVELEGLGYRELVVRGGGGLHGWRPGAAAVGRWPAAAEAARGGEGGRGRGGLVGGGVRGVEGEVGGELGLVGVGWRLLVGGEAGALLLVLGGVVLGGLFHCGGLGEGLGALLLLLLLLGGVVVGVVLYGGCRGLLLVLWYLCLGKLWVDRRSLLVGILVRRLLREALRRLWLCCRLRCLLRLL